MSAYTRNTLPVVPLRGIVAMPYVILSFDLGNSANIAAVDTAVGEDNRIIIVCRRDPRDPDTSRPALYDHA